MRQHLQLAVVLGAASLAAIAQSAKPHLYHTGNEWVQEVTGTLSAEKIVKVKSSAGSIRAQGAQQDNITYTVREHVVATSEESARREFARMKFTTFSSNGAVLLRADCEGASHGSINFDILVPAQTVLVRLQTEGGAVTAKNLAGRVEATTGAGSISLDQIQGLVLVNSGGGDIEIGKAGSNVHATTNAGNIRIGSVAGRIDANSGGGNLDIGSAKVMALQTGGGFIRVARCDGQIKAETAGGNIELIDIEGAAQIETGGGSIHIGPIKGGIRAETGAGAIVAKLASGGAAFTASRLETSMGDITVYVPDGLGVTVRAAVEVARGYGIRSEFPELKITDTKQNLGPREAYAEGALNGGGPVLHVHTTAGNIEFKRKQN
jgi:DUF4097 and DUF4098 domain-containing protein YvlB